MTFVGLTPILVEEDPDNVGLALESIIKTLGHELPNIRGNAANLLAIIGSKEVIPYPQALKDKDEEKAVRERLSRPTDRRNKAAMPKPKMPVPKWRGRKTGASR